MRLYLGSFEAGEAPPNPPGPQHRIVTPDFSNVSTATRYNVKKLTISCLAASSTLPLSSDSCRHFMNGRALCNVSLQFDSSNNDPCFWSAQQIVSVEFGWQRAIFPKAGVRPWKSSLSRLLGRLATLSSVNSGRSSRALFTRARNFSKWFGPY